MDEAARINRRRWDALSRAGAIYSRPRLDLDAAAARGLVDEEGRLGDLAGRDVLCLAGGGGMQSAAFGVLGARVTVLDLSEEQLARDREAAAHYDHPPPRLEQGDMRDLARFPDASFDVVWHGHSINFVPDPSPAFAEAARVLRSGGWYHTHFINPFIHGTWERGWNGTHYALAAPYAPGPVVEAPWTFEDGTRLEGPLTFKQPLSRVLDGLTATGLDLRAFREDTDGDPAAEPGSWPHFKTVAAPWLMVWCQRR